MNCIFKNNFSERQCHRFYILPKQYNTWHFIGTIKAGLNKWLLGSNFNQYMKQYTKDPKREFVVKTNKDSTDNSLINTKSHKYSSNW